MILLRDLALEAGATGFLGKEELTRLEGIIAPGGKIIDSGLSHDA